MRECLRKKIVKMFKTRGYIDNILFFVEADEAVKADKAEEAIKFLLNLLQEESLKSSIVDAESIKRVISPLLRCVEEESYLVFIDAKYRYDAVTKQFIIMDPSLFTISSIQSLVFQMGRKWVMGLDITVGRWTFLPRRHVSFCEDCQYKITTGFFTENTIMLAEGEMQDGI